MSTKDLPHSLFYCSSQRLAAFSLPQSQYLLLTACLQLVVPKDRFKSDSRPSLVKGLARSLCKHMDSLSGAQVTHTSAWRADQAVW